MYARCIAAVILFLIVQMLGGMIALAVTGGGNAVAEGSASPELSVDTLSFVSIATGVVSVLLIGCGLRMIVWKRTFALNGSTLRNATTAAALLGALAAIFGSNLLSELLSLPDNMSAQFQAMATTPWGAISIAVVAPLVEELIFREGMMGSLLRQGAHPSAAVLVSSAAFAFMHLNPAQIPFAFLMGLVLALLYGRTRSIWLPLFIHLLNNGLAVILMNTSHADRFTDLLGLSLPLAILLTIVAMVLSAALLIPFCRSAQNA